MDDQNEELECSPLNAWSALLDRGTVAFSSSYRVLGSQLGLDTTDLNSCKEAHGAAHDYKQRLFNVLEMCYHRDELSWAKLVKVLRREALGENTVAQHIEKAYLSNRKDSSVSMDSAVSLSLSASLSSSEPFSPTSPTLMEYGESPHSYSDTLVEVDHECICTIPNVINEIARSGVQDWQLLGVFLGLSSIDLVFPPDYGLMEKYQLMVEAWFRKDPDASWHKLRAALSSTTATPCSPRDIESELKAFETRFRRLHTDARRQLELKHNSIELIKEELDTLPHEIRRENRSRVRKVLNKMGRFTNLKLLFEEFRAECWNYFEYGVLEVLISNCDENLQERMRKYGRDLQLFKERTTITEFMECKLAYTLVKNAEVLPTCRMLSTKHDIHPDKYTLAKLDKFRLKTAKKVRIWRKLSEWALQFYRVQYGSIIAEWLFPEELMDAFVELFSSKEGEEILAAFMIVRLLIDGKTIPTHHLLAAMREEDIAEIKRLLDDTESDLDVNCGDEENDEQTVLLYTSKRGDADIVGLLVEKWKADVNKGDKIQRTALMLSSHEGHTDLVGFLLENGALPNLQAQGGWTALMLASYRGHVETVLLLLDPKYHTDINVTTEQGQTALQRVCLYSKARYTEVRYDASPKNVEVAKLLLDHGTDIQILDDEGRTPLIAASDRGFVEIVKLLIKKISEWPDEKRQKYLDHKKHYSWTALMCASEQGHAKVVEVLIEAGARRDIAKDKDAVTALHIAIQNGHTEVVEAMTLTYKMEKDDLNARDDYGMTPLMLAINARREQIINVLIHAGVDINAKSDDEEQMTALMFAVKVGSFDVVKMLVENKANIFELNSKSQTVMEMAKHSSKEIHDYLVQKCKEAEERRATASH